MPRVLHGRPAFAKSPWYLPDRRVPQWGILPEAKPVLRGVATVLAIDLGIAVIGTTIFLLI